MASEIKHQVSDVVFAADGRTVLFGPGELHDPGSLPDGVRFREVLATEAEVAAAPVHATPAAGKTVTAEAAAAPVHATPAAGKTVTAEAAGAEAAAGKPAAKHAGKRGD